MCVLIVCYLLDTRLPAVSVRKRASVAQTERASAISHNSGSLLQYSGLILSRVVLFLHLLVLGRGVRMTLPMCAECHVQLFSLRFSLIVVVVVLAFFFVAPIRASDCLLVVSI